MLRMIHFTWKKLANHALFYQRPSSKVRENQF